MRNPYLISGPALVSFSGGRTSAFLLARILDAHGGGLPDDVIPAFCHSGRMTTCRVGTPPVESEPSLRVRKRPLPDRIPCPRPIALSLASWQDQPGGGCRWRPRFSEVSSLSLALAFSRVMASFLCR